MTARPTDDWLEMSRRELAAAIAGVTRRLGGDLRAPPGARAAYPPSTGSQDTGDAGALGALRRAFGLSDFERDVIVLCAAPELEPEVGRQIAQARGDERRLAPTPELAMSILPNAHWSAFAPAAPLRRWHLLEVISGELVTTSSLRLDERVLQFLVGVDCTDEHLEAVTTAVEPSGSPFPTAREQAAAVALAWTTGGQPLVQLCGDRRDDAESIAGIAAATLGWRVRRLRSSDVPAAASDRHVLARWLEREAALAGLVIMVDTYDAEPAAAERAVALLDCLAAPALVAGRDALQGLRRPWQRLDVPRSSAADRRVLWQAALHDEVGALNGEGTALLESIARDFSFDALEITTTAHRTRLRLAASGLSQDPPAQRLAEEVRHQCRITARARLEALADRNSARPSWDDLVLPAAHLDTLREIAAHVRQRHRVYEAWGFGAEHARGLGVSALFVGASGTGKTMAAEVLAAELDLDLWRVDLSAVVSKYIGETEKNLSRVFDAAGNGNAILLFDEADALFGKRSEVKDSHDRYANIEVSYLLQRMESYRGLAILTTNQRSALDPAFLRRIRFALSFPFPDEAARERIWQRAFPLEVPRRDLDPHKLARLGVAGGSIRNIALNAAFLAADAGEPVQMKHLVRSARSECAKIERAPLPAEIDDWVEEP